MGDDYIEKILCAFLVLSVLSIQSFAADISARSAVVYDCYSNSVVYEKNADERLPIASLTKIMTGFIASELYNSDAVVTVQSNWCGIEGSSMYLSPGEKLKISELMHGLMLMSGNDAAVALASLYSGNVQILLN